MRATAGEARRRGANSIRIVFDKFDIGWSKFCSDSSDPPRGARSTRRLLKVQRWPGTSLYFLSSRASAAACARLEYTNRIGDLFIERRKRARVRLVRVLYRIVLSGYTSWTRARARVSPHPRRTSASAATSAYDPRRPPRAISGEIVERTGIKLYRISDFLRSGNTRTFGN